MDGQADFRGTRRFAPVRCLGQGGTGVVYEALDREHDAHVALKVLHETSAEALLRFKNEFRVMQDLSHPNLVTLGELIEDAGQWFFTMEFVAGVDFLRWVRRRRRLDDSEATTVSLRTRLRSQDGAAAVPAVTAPPRFDPVRLRAALVQLVRGLSVLHEAGKIHRDIKPSNILVTPDGRVVILDFGLVIDVHRRHHVTHIDHVVGTADYMAPEQAAGLEIGPAADWYAVGVVLYQALTGRLPFEGADLEVLRAKQALDPPAPATIAPQVPADLDELCRLLLARDPAARPSGREILRTLTTEPGSRPLPLPAPSRGAPFVGRAHELATLARGFDDARRGRAVSVLLLGESGIGKSALAARFAELTADEQGAVCLRGRCYDRESVPYKAVDGIIDALARYMTGLPKVDVAALLPLHAALLPRIFPVLRRVEVIAHAPVHPQSISDPKELRTQVFDALRELLTRLAMRHPLVLVVDDLQWTDADSLALLRALLRPPDPPGLLLIATVAAESGGIVTADLVAALPGDVRQLALERLPPADARALATALLADAAADGDAIARGAEGHPLFIAELVQHAAAGGAGSAQPVRLEQALWSRIERLQEAPRSIVELTAVAGAPLEKDALARATGLEPAELLRHVAALRSANLVRTSGVRRTDTVEPYHERVRAAALEYLDLPRQRACHERIAVALAEAADAEARAMHWHAAGRPERAAEHALAAAAVAEQALAFDRAARLYRLVLDLGPPPGTDAHALQIRLGGALANAGRSREAAEAYLHAAETAPAAHALDLRGKAGGQLLISGHIDQGLRVYSKVLEAARLRLAPRGRLAVPSLLLRRAQLRLRGLGFRARPEAEVDPADLQRIDIGFAISAGLAVDPVRGSQFHTVHLLLALKAGEPKRVARALCGEAIYLGARGHRRGRLEAVLKATRALATELQDPQVLAIAAVAEGVSAFLLGRWRSAREQCERGAALLREHCTGVAWELTNSHIFLLRSLYYLGEVRELARRLPGARDEALALGNLHGVSQLPAGTMTIERLAQDDVAGARRATDEAIARWGQQGTHVMHHVELLGRVHIDLYAGAGRDAFERVCAAWRSARIAMLTGVQMIRIQMHDLRARSALAAALEVKDAPHRRGLLADAARSVRWLDRERPAWAGALARLTAAGVCAGRGDRAGALVQLDQAVRCFEAADMALHAAVARHRQGELLGGPAGHALMASADAWLSAQGIVRPARIAAMLAPGFPDQA